MVKKIHHSAKSVSVRAPAGQVCIRGIVGNDETRHCGLYFVQGIVGSVEIMHCRLCK
jgi:hypothetical protein